MSFVPQRRMKRGGSNEPLARAKGAFTVWFCKSIFAVDTVSPRAAPNESTIHQESIAINSDIAPLPSWSRMP